MVRKIRVKAPAKINLFLEVTGKRPDGYHDLAMLFAGISLADELTLAKTEKPGMKPGEVTCKYIISKSR